MRKFITFALVLVLAFGLIGCSSKPAAEQEPAPAPATDTATEPATEPAMEMIDLKISGHPAPHSLPNAVAMEKGFFEENGLNVENTYYISGLAQQEAAPSRTWDCGICGIPPTINGALNYGVKIVGFSIYDDAPQALFVREDSPIWQSGKGHIDGYPDLYGTVEDWKGTTILMPKGTTAHVLTLATLDALGLTEADVNIVHMEVPAAAQAFKAGEGDVMAQWSTFTYDAEQAGFKMASSAKAVGLNLPSPIIVTSDILEENPEAVQRYVNTTVSTLQWINDESNRDELIDIYYNMCIDEGVVITEDACRWSMDIHHVPTIEHLEELLEVNPETGLNGYQETVEDVLDFLIRAGVYQEEQKAAVLDAIDLTYMENAIAAYKAK